MTRIFTILAPFLLLQSSFAAEPEHVTLHYRPPESIFGDPIPFYHDGVHHVFYLCPDFIVGSTGKALAWHHLASPSKAFHRETLVS